MPKKTPQNGGNANGPAPSSGAKPKGGSVQTAPRRASVAAPPKAPAVPRSQTLVQPTAAQLAQIANMVRAQVEPKKKKKKKSILSKVGGFLEGALKKAISIAPAIVHSLANTVHPTWQQGSVTPATLKQLSARTPREGLPSILPRVNPPTPDNPIMVVSKRQLTFHPDLANQLKNQGIKMVAVPNAQFAAPVALGGHLSYAFETTGDRHSKFGNGLRIRGSDYLDDVVGTGSTITRGTPVGNIDLNPGRWDGSRIAKYAGMYERFIINSLSVVYTPGCSTSTGGSLVGWFDDDPNDTAGSGRDAVVRALSCVGQDNAPVWASHIAHFKRDPEQPDYYVDANGSDDRLTSAGSYFLTVMADLAALTGSYGSLSIVYDVSFFVPSVQLVSPGASPEYVLTGGGTMSATNPMGTVPVENPNNSMDLSILVGTSGGQDFFYGFQGSYSMPGTYLWILDITGTTLVSVSESLGTGVTSGFRIYVPNGAATRMLAYGKFTVQPTPDQDPTAVFWSPTLNAATVSASSLRFFRASSALALKNFTLQDFERLALETQKKVDSLVSTLEKKKLLEVSVANEMPPLASNSLTGQRMELLERLARTTDGEQRTLLTRQLSTVERLLSPTNV